MSHGGRDLTTIENLTDKFHYSFGNRVVMMMMVAFPVPALLTMGKQAAKDENSATTDGSSKQECQRTRHPKKG